MCHMVYYSAMLPKIQLLYGKTPSNQFSAQNTTESIGEQNYTQDKKRERCWVFFQNRRFNGKPEQFVDNLIRDFEIWATRQCLYAQQMSLFSVEASADPARPFFLTNCSSRIPFNQILPQMRRHYNSETRKIQLQFEMDGLDWTAFMSKHQQTDYREGLTKIVNHIYSLAFRLPKDLETTTCDLRLFSMNELNSPYYIYVIDW